MTLTGVLMPLLLMAGAAVGIGLWWRRRDISRRAAFEALAARRGWSLNVGKQSLGRPGTLRLASRGGPEWRLTVRGTVVGPDRITDFHADEPQWTNGYLLVTSADPDEDTDDDAEDAGLPAPARDVRATVHALGAEGMGADLMGMGRIDAPPGLIALATADPTLRVDLSDLARTLSDSAFGDGPQAARAVMLLGPDGLRLRLGQPLRNADRAEAFIDLAQAIGRTVG